MTWAAELKSLSAFTGDVLIDEPLAKHTYFKIGGPARALVIPKSLDDLRLLSRFIKELGIEFRFIGLGSNLLAPDDGVPFLCIKTTKVSNVTTNEAAGIRIGASVPVAAFLRKAAAEGWAGFEAISGIPGTIGGIVAMNGGTHLGEASDRLLEVRTFDLGNPEGELLIRAGKELSFSYRKNHFLSPTEIVVDSLWRLEPGDPEKIRELLDGLYRRRKETQPLEYPSCGSVFKNPKSSGLKAWEVIDRLGLRGHRVGNAQFSEKHPNWISNLGNAKASDVLALIHMAKARALAELSVELSEEVRLL